MSTGAIPRADASVVIPAYNEEKVIARCLRSMLEGAEPGELEIVVACNGCKDRTADIARGFGPDVRVVETAEASKTAALNMGDDAATRFPRFYVDADVVLNIRAFREVAQALRTGPWLAAAPRMVVDLADRPWTIRAYYRVWTALPYFDSQIGAGVYAVSEAGRKRWTVFPKIIADDEFAHLHFADHERLSVRTCEFYMKPPATLSGLIHIFTRVRAGVYEIRAKRPDLAPGTKVKWGETIRRVLRDPSLWTAAPVYAYVVILTKYKGYRRAKAGKSPAWRPEESSRSDPLRTAGS